MNLIIKLNIYFAKSLAVFGVYLANEKEFDQSVSAHRTLRDAGYPAVVLAGLHKRPIKRFGAGMEFHFSKI
jgi:hypothetical protein